MVFITISASLAGISFTASPRMRCAGARLGLRFSDSVPAAQYSGGSFAHADPPRFRHAAVPRPRYVEMPAPGNQAGAAQD